MSGLNVWMGIGNLGRDCELRYTPAGAAVATINLACSETWTDKSGQRQERTEWVRVVLWGKTAEALSEYLRKGKQVCVTGKLQTRSWDDKDGNKRHTTEIRADRVVLLGGGERRGGSPDAHLRDEDVAAGEGPSMPLTDDDIPFAWLLPFILPIGLSLVHLCV